MTPDAPKCFRYDYEDGHRVKLGSGMSGPTYRGAIRIRRPSYQTTTSASDEFRDGEEDLVWVPAALKCFTLAVSERDDGKNIRLDREVIILGRLKHPNIVRYLKREYDEHTPILATEYIEGHTLERHVELAANKLQISDRDWILNVLDWSCQLAWALEYLEKGKIVHRDIKPSNIVIDRHESRPVLIDFGIGKHIGASDNSSGMTTGGTFSFDFAAPEQVVSCDKADVTSPKSDVYSLAATMVFCLAPEVISEDREDRRKQPDFGSFLSRLPDVPGLQGLLGIMLAPDPNDRPSASEVGSSINRILSTWAQVEVVKPTEDLAPPLKDDHRELPKFISIGNGVEVADRLLSRAAYAFWSERDEASIELGITTDTISLAYDEALELLRLINAETAHEPYRYRMPRVEEWYASVGAPLRSMKGLSSTTTSLRGKSALLDATADRYEWCHETSRADVYPECRKVCFFESGVPKATDRHKKWPKGSLRLVREPRMTEST